MKSIYTYIVFFLMASVMLDGCIKIAPEADFKVNANLQPLGDIIKYSYQFSLFKAAMAQAGLTDSIVNTQSYTLFLPDNDAFAMVGIRDSTAFKKMNVDSLRHFLKYHIVRQSLSYADIPRKVDNIFITADGNPIYISKAPDLSDTSPQDTASVNGIGIKIKNIQGGNGFIHVLKTPLFYPASTIATFLSSKPEYSYQVKKFKQFGIWDQLSRPGLFTVFVVPDSIFNKRVIAYGVIPFGGFNGFNYGFKPPRNPYIYFKDIENIIDTLHFKKALFEVYIIPNSRIFMSDFYELPPTPARNDGSYSFLDVSKSYSVTFSYDAGYAGEGDKPPINLSRGIAVGAQGIEPNGIINNLLFTDGVVYYISPFLNNVKKGNFITGNGVVHELTRPLATPDLLSN